MSAAASFALGSFAKGAELPFLGAVIGEEVVPLGGLFSDVRTPHALTLSALLQDWDRNFDTLNKSIVLGAYATSPIPVTDLHAHAPLTPVSNIFCAGANYRQHVIEMVVTLGVPPKTDGMTAGERRAFGEAYVARQLAESNPYIFMKPSSSVAGPCDELVLPAFSSKVDWELELGVVIARPTHQVTRLDAGAAIAGFVIVNDITARDKVMRTDPGAIGPDWLAAKGAPGFLTTGPYFVPKEFVANPQDLGMRLQVNGEIMQDARTSDMTFDIARQIEYIAAHVRLLPGDLLCTGSPAGNGIVRGRFLKGGDWMEAEIEGLGRQSIRCVDPA